MKNLLSSLFVLCIFYVQSQEKNRLSLEHYKNYEWTSNPKLSPDGEQILYSRTWINLVDDKRETDLWIMNKDGSTNRFFMNGSNGKWSPNGNKNNGKLTLVVLATTLGVPIRFLTPTMSPQRPGT